MKRTHEKILWITRTAVLLAMLIVLQAVTKGFSQLVTGSCVNAVLAVAAIFGGLWCGVVIAVISPVLAFLLGIAPQLVTVPAIMVGNTVFVLLLHVLNGEAVWSKALAWLVAAVAKFVSLYAIVVWLICGLASESLLASGILKAPMLTKLPVMFGLPQLFTALIGGGVAMLITPVLKKALKK